MIIDDFIYTGYLISRKRETGANFAVIGAYASLMFFVNIFSFIIFLIWIFNLSLLALSDDYQVLMTTTIFVVFAFFIIYSNYVLSNRKGKRMNKALFFTYIILSYVIASLCMIFFIRPESAPPICR